MMHARTILLAILGCLGAPADGPTIITFDAVETGKPMPSYTDQGVVFALSHPPTKSRAAGKVMFFPHLKTPRKGILNAMANESIPVEIRFPKPVASVTLVLWGSIGSKAVVEAYDADGKVAGPGVPGQGAGADRAGAADPQLRADGEGTGDRLRPLLGRAAGRLPRVRRGPRHAGGRSGRDPVAASRPRMADSSIGTAVSSRHLDNPALAALVAEQFDCLTAENEFKPAVPPPAAGRVPLHRRRTGSSTSPGEHRMKVVGHTLCWHSQSPAFLFRGPDGKPLPRDEALKNLKDHIDGVVGHFKGKVVGWDVVNEAISDAEGRIPAQHPGTPGDRRRLHRQGVRVRARGRPRRRAVLQRLRQRAPREAREDDPPDPRAEGPGRAPRRRSGSSATCGSMTPTPPIGWTARSRPTRPRA